MEFVFSANNSGVKFTPLFYDTYFLVRVDVCIDLQADVDIRSPIWFVPVGVAISARKSPPYKFRCEFVKGRR